MATVIRRLAPKAFVFENVRGLQSARWTENGRKGEIFDDVREAFDNLNEYRAAWSLLYARHYGVPQNRPRIFLVGIRNDIKIKGETADEDAVMRGFLPAPSGDAAPHPIDLLGDLIDPTYEPGAKSTETYPSMPLNELQYRLRSDRNGVLAEMGSQITDHVYSRHNEHVRRKFDAMRAPGRVVPEELKTRKFSQRVIPKKWGPSGPTITATSMPDDYVHFAQSRTLTVREWARLQMFPTGTSFRESEQLGGFGALATLE